MKDLDKIIQENKEQFDSFEPAKGHEQRFQEKLKKRKTALPEKNISVGMILRAAVVTILIGLTAWFFVFEKTQLSQNEKQGKSLSEVSPEYKEVEMYLKKDVEKKMEKLENLQCSKTQIEKEEIIKEIQQIDTMYNNLQQELLHNGNDQRIINAMINSYRMKSEVLERVLKKVNKNC